MSSQPKIIVAPLNWGLGHATRCIPLIKALLSLGCDVHLGGSQTSGSLLKSNFPGLPYRELPDYAIRYPEKGSFTWAMAKQTPKVIKAIRAEHEAVKDWAYDIRPDIIISDHRYGVYAPGARNWILTHQVRLAVGGWAGTIANSIHDRYLNKFDRILVPDFGREPRLAGKLSNAHSTIPTQYLGPLSRFEKPARVDQQDIHNLIIISGPEPQRSNFESWADAWLQHQEGNHVVVAGQPGASNTSSDRYTRLSHANDAVLADVVGRSQHIICRSGYSTLMDLWAWKKHAYIFPTPGQHEQLALAKHHHQKGWHHWLKDLPDPGDKLGPLTSPTAHPLSDERRLIEILHHLIQQ